MYFTHAYICILFSLSSRTLLAHALRLNSFHRCSSFTSHCGSFISLLQKRPRRRAHAFHFPARFQVQPSYISTFMWPLVFVHPPWASSLLRNLTHSTIINACHFCEMARKLPNSWRCASQVHIPKGQKGLREDGARDINGLRPLAIFSLWYRI